MMKIYIAGSFVAQKRLRPFRDKLFHMGHCVVGTWLDEIAKPADLSQEQFDRKLAIKDLQEIREADCLIIDTQEQSTTGGRMVELGFSIAHHKLIYNVGLREHSNSIFLQLSDKRFDTWDDVFAYFEKAHPGTTTVATGMEGKVFSPAKADSNEDPYEDQPPFSMVEQTKPEFPSGQLGEVIYQGKKV